MGYDLHNTETGDYFCANGGGWNCSFEAGLAFNWKPAGTLHPINDENGGAEYFAFEAQWEGVYFTNDYQRVTTQDAAAWAAALRRAIHAAEIVTKDSDNFVSSSELYLTARQENCARTLNNKSLEFLRKFADYCDKGGFDIG
jgi:hypothetical protein